MDGQMDRPFLNGHLSTGKQGALQCRDSPMQMAMPHDAARFRQRLDEDRCKLIRALLRSRIGRHVQESRKVCAAKRRHPLVEECIHDHAMVFGDPQFRSFGMAFGFVHDAFSMRYNTRQSMHVNLQAKLEDRADDLAMHGCGSAIARADVLGWRINIPGGLRHSRHKHQLKITTPDLCAVLQPGTHRHRLPRPRTPWSACWCRWSRGCCRSRPPASALWCRRCSV